MVVCAICKKPLHGIPKNLEKLSKSEKRVSRKFGGYLCYRCTRKALIESI